MLSQVCSFLKRIITVMKILYILLIQKQLNYQRHGALKVNQDRKDHVLVAEKEGNVH